MFYQCKKCKKTWQYPVEKCPDCFLELERIKSAKIKVIGISKVNIPTIFHPKAPYFVLLLEDENKNRWAHKSIKEYTIGDVFEINSSSDDNAVAIWRVKYEALEAIEKIIELLQVLELKRESKILILPTLISPAHAHFRKNTSPEFLEAVLKFLFTKGIKAENIKIGAQSFDENLIEAAAQKSGLLNICMENKILPLDLAKTNFVKKDSHQLGGGGLEISEEVFNSDFILNLPILKVGKASAAENILKVLKKENYLSLKNLSSDKEILKSLNKELPNFLTLGEAEAVQKPDSFTVFFGLVLASFNPFNLDRVFNEISTVKELPEILKEIKIEDVPILGRKIEEVGFKP